MKYFEALFKKYYEIPFKKDESGRTVFYPWSLFGKGYILPDDKTEKRLRGFARLEMMVILPLFVAVIAISGGLIDSSPLLLPLCLILILWRYFIIKALIRGFPVSNIKVPHKEVFADTAKSFNKIILWILFICCLLLAAVSLLVLIKAISNNNEVMSALFSCLFFGVGALTLAYMIKANRT